ncbi:hypothetical protein [Arthrobacter zhaoxinii]|uniref:hypothetical protein n=1 Tax=Arthrobacter zhaoxinii TaxID=2964616 RepID=UPI00210599E2|nr:hypothetical protein [Arthrobacter zhaoxinii]MCQ2000029.1 hypothetical protein [Arthrobacter zhaoxinii]
MTPEREETPPVPAAASEPGSAPGYLPRLLSAAAYVSLLASDRTLERFGLNRNSFGVLERLASEAATEGVLAEATGQPPAAVQRDLADLRSSGYALPDESGAWSVTDAGRRAIECAHLASAEASLDKEDSRELRQALHSLIASLRLERPDGESRP